MKQRSFSYKALALAVLYSACSFISTSNAFEQVSMESATSYVKLIDGIYMITVASGPRKGEFLTFRGYDSPLTKAAALSPLLNPFFALGWATIPAKANELLLSRKHSTTWALKRSDSNPSQFSLQVRMGKMEGKSVRFATGLGVKRLNASREQGQFAFRAIKIPKTQDWYYLEYAGSAGVFGVYNPGNNRVISLRKGRGTPFRIQILSRIPEKSE